MPIDKENVNIIAINERVTKLEDLLKSYGYMIMSIEKDLHSGKVMRKYFKCRFINDKDCDFVYCFSDINIKHMSDGEFMHMLMGIVLEEAQWEDQSTKN